LRGIFRAVTLSFALIVGLAPLCLADAELNRGEDTVRDIPPSRGRARRAYTNLGPTVQHCASLPSAARNFTVLYNSRSPDDSDVVVSARLHSSGHPPAGGWPLITGPRTTGLASQCAPSSDTVDGPEHGYLSLTQAMLGGFVKRGYAVVATDYGRFGAARIPAYLVGVGEGRSALDIMRAARKVDLAIGTRYVVMGIARGARRSFYRSNRARLCA